MRPDSDFGEAAAREGFFFEAVRRLDASPEFVRAIERIPLPLEDGIEEFVEDLCRKGASLYCANPEARPSRPASKKPKPPRSNWPNAASTSKDRRPPPWPDCKKPWPQALSPHRTAPSSSSLRTGIKRLSAESC